jgi:hypothetical protein
VQYGGLTFLSNERHFFSVSSVSVVVGPKVIRAIQLRVCPDKANQKGRVSVTGVYARQEQHTAGTDEAIRSSRDVQNSEQSVRANVEEHSRQFIEL